MTELRLRGDRLQWLEADGEVVALDEVAAMYLNANPSGALLWRELAAGTTRDRLADLLVETYALERGVAEADVDAFLAELRGRDLLDG